MIRFAICDDEPKWIETAREIVDKFFTERSIEIVIETFDSAQLLLETATMQNKQFAESMA